MALSRTQVLDAALAILDEYGLGDLTMRRLASSLGVQPGALYWHVTNKQALLAQMADEILADLPRITPGVDPDLDPDLGPGAALDAVGAWCRALRAALLAHRDGAEVVATAFALRSGADPAAASLTSLVATLGLPPDHAQAAAAALVHYVLGHTTDEQAHAQLASSGALESPSPRRDGAAHFEFGLGLVLDGLAVRTQAARTSAVRPDRRAR